VLGLTSLESALAGGGPGREPNVTAVGTSFESGRIEAFSDGVFAIAITLLVLDISVPTAEFDHMWHAIGDEWPSYIAYVTSFWTIGGLWIVHHGIFRRMRNADYTVLLLNLLLLMFVAFLPFPTKLMAEALNAPTRAGEHPAVLFYGATLLAISMTVTGIARYAAARPVLVPEGPAQDEVSDIATRTAPSLGFYGVVIALAFLAPKVAVFGYLVVSIIAVLPRPTRFAPHRGGG
jgi:TMEM175 potassium channel family protein